MSALAATLQPTHEPPRVSQRCRGWKDIAARLEATTRLYAGKELVTVAVNTAIGYSRLSCDPLPIRTYRGEAWCWPKRIDDWLARRKGGLYPDGSSLAITRGWDDIRKSIGDVSHRTAVRWATSDEDPLPVSGRRKDGCSEDGVWIYTTALRDWNDRHDLPIQAVDVRAQDLRKGTQHPVTEPSNHAAGIATRCILAVGMAATRSDIDDLPE